MADQLLQMINNRCDQIRVINKSKNKAALQTGIRAYVDYIASAWDPKSVCLHPGDLEDEHAEGERRALAAYRPDRVTSGKVYFDTTDPDEKILCEVLRERFKEIEDLNTSSNQTAVQAALNVYKSEMEHNCGFSVWWVFTLGITYAVNKTRRNKYHLMCRNKAISKFAEYRRYSSSSATDRFFDDLESKIAAERKKY